MNAEQAYKEIALSVYELAEAERLDRKAKALRLKSAKRLSVLGAYFKEGIEQVKQGQNDLGQSPTTEGDAANLNQPTKQS